MVDEREHIIIEPSQAKYGQKSFMIFVQAKATFNIRQVTNNRYPISKVDTNFKFWASDF